MQKLLIFIMLSISAALYSEEYEFAGKHFFASYLECDREALADVERLKQAMDRAVLASGATILNQCDYVFPPDGLTLVYLLSESHASIHTYPEHGACFVDLFTCGQHCSYEPFDQMLRAYLQPQAVEERLFLRGEVVEGVSH